jgi:hypothetical protein
MLMTKEKLFVQSLQLLHSNDEKSEKELENMWKKYKERAGFYSKQGTLHVITLDSSTFCILANPQSKHH